MFEQLTYLEAKKKIVNFAKNESFKPVNAAVLRNVVVEQMEVFYKYFCGLQELAADVRFGEFDNILQDVVREEDPLLNNDTDIILVFYNLEFAYPELLGSFEAYARHDLEAIEKFIHTSEGIGGRIYGLGLNSFIENLNNKTFLIMREFADCFLIDFDVLRAKEGGGHFYDDVRKISTAAPYSVKALREVSFELSKYTRALKGKRKKCIICDCDNTLWGGIAGESEIRDLQVGKEGFPRGAYYRFQVMLRSLKERGILVALCSKNNEGEVWDVFEKNKGMALSREDIVAYKINWNDKASNIKELALDLNIGLDSFVFVDDSDFECNLIRESLPEVEVFKMGRNPLDTIRDILESGLFDHFSASDEDRRRSLMYSQDVKRKVAKVSSVDLKEYLRCLQIDLIITENDHDNYSRIAQLTQKTNQFNLSTKRYSVSNILDLMSSSTHRVFSLQVRDKFGDLGIVGVAVVGEDRGEKSYLDTFLISCRALGRHIEKAFLAEISKSYLTKGFSDMEAIYLPTKKNSQVYTFLSAAGLTILDETREMVTFRGSLKDLIQSDELFNSVTFVVGENSE
jgi:FkbH-like protein